MGSRIFHGFVFVLWLCFRQCANWWAIMSKYTLKVLEISVHEWNDEEGIGAFKGLKGGYEIDNYDSLDEAKQDLNKYFECKIPDESYQGEYIYHSQIENDIGLKSNKGSYLSDYVLCIEKQVKVNFNNEELQWQIKCN